MPIKSKKLEELEALIEEYNESAEAVLHHDDRQHIQHLLNELHEKLIHAEELQHAASTESEQKKHFLDRHAEILKQINEHILLLHESFEAATEEVQQDEREDTEEDIEEIEGYERRQLVEYEHRILKLMQEIKREFELRYERFHMDPMKPHPFPWKHEKDE